jgi:dolichol-phosphate hexosyltransferase
METSMIDSRGSGSAAHPGGEPEVDASLGELRVDPSAKFRTAGLGGGRSNRGPRSRGEVVVLLPALNEAAAIAHVIARIPTAGLRSQGYDVAVWVVDGQSTDRTMEIAREMGAKTFVQSGTGKGNAVREALTHLLTRPPAGETGESRLFVMLDADGTYPAEAIPRFVEALESGEEVVLGSRLRGSIAEGAISGLNLLGNRLLSFLASLLFRVPVTDVCTGMWGFRADALRRFGLVAEGFDLEADMFASTCERRARFRELPIPYDRRIGEPKLVPLRTGIAIAWRLLVRRLNRPAKDPLRIHPASGASREEPA